MSEWSEARELIYSILKGTCTIYRKGEEVTKKQVGDVEVTTIMDMPHINENRNEQVIDVHFFVVAFDGNVDIVKAGLETALAHYPHPERLAGGPSYIELGGEMGDQGAALQLIALGKAVGIWDVITPEMLGITGSQADEMAGGGLVMCSGWKMKVET